MIYLIQVSQAIKSKNSLLQKTKVLIFYLLYGKNIEKASHIMGDCVSQDFKFYFLNYFGEEAIDLVKYQSSNLLTSTKTASNITSVSPVTFANLASDSTSATLATLQGTKSTR